MPDREKVVKGLTKCVKTGFEKACPAGCPYFQICFPDVGPADPFMQLMQDALALLKEQEAVVRCEDCENWIPGYITDHDDFIPPKCGKYQQMVGHSAADYCSLAARKESR